MSSAQSRAQARRAADRLHRGLADDVLRLRTDAGLSRAALGREAGVDLAYLRRVEGGSERPSLETYARLAAVLGADLSARLYPNTGPTVRDRHQARILEALLAVIHPRWHTYVEVAVRRPSRGWIDAVLHEPTTGLAIALEIQSALPRLEQLIRWSSEKAASLPSWDDFGQLGLVTTVSRLLIVRSSRATRDVARAFPRQLEMAYPAHPADALAALTAGGRPWPGAALVWANLTSTEVRFIDRRAAERSSVGQSAS